ncbi:hypothetical protein [Halorussus ruber]|uniref:hypothetical protein n=1 Tax=Halorussus ruber TaxID=1126238 RepID=UPI00109260FA|nr:hypothetical protein [Halorussus ruber]
MQPLAVLVLGFGLLVARSPEPFAAMHNAGAEDPTPGVGQLWFFRYVSGGALVLLGVLWFVS